MTTFISLDDDTYMGAIYRSISRKFGARHQNFFCLSEAYEWLGECTQAPKLALLDYCLPDGNSLNFATALRLKFPALSTALITGLDAPNYTVQTDEPLFDRVFTKPFSVAQISQFAQQSLHHNQEPSQLVDNSELNIAFQQDLYRLASTLDPTVETAHQDTQRALHSLIGVAAMLGDTALSNKAHKAHDALPYLPKMLASIMLMQIIDQAHCLAESLSFTHSSTSPNPALRA